MGLRVGARYRSQVCPTEVVVVRPGPPEATLGCGGHPMVELDAEPADGLAPLPGFDGGSLLGKRYTDAARAVEVLVTKPGTGTLAVDGEALVVKEAKPLPASD